MGSGCGIDLTAGGGCGSGCGIRTSASTCHNRCTPVVAEAAAGTALRSRALRARGGIQARGTSAWDKRVGPISEQREQQGAQQQWQRISLFARVAGCTACMQ